jgi:hypothetical protein
MKACFFIAHISVTDIIGKKQTHRGQPFNSQLGPWVTLYRRKGPPLGLGDRGFLQWQDSAQGQANNGEQVQMDAFKSSIPLGRAPGWACRSQSMLAGSTLSLKPLHPAWRGVQRALQLILCTTLCCYTASRAPLTPIYIFSLTTHLPCHPWRKVSSSWTVPGHIHTCRSYLRVPDMLAVLNEGQA